MRRVEVRADDQCTTCHGAGRRVYSSGATWRGGVGTASAETDLCDACWGSGDKFRPFTNIRELEAKLAQKRAADALEDFLGSGGLGVFAAQEPLAWVTDQLRKLARKRWKEQPPRYALLLLETFASRLERVARRKGGLK